MSDKGFNHSNKSHSPTLSTYSTCDHSQAFQWPELSLNMTPTSPWHFTLSIPLPPVCSLSAEKPRVSQLISAKPQKHEYEEARNGDHRVEWGWSTVCLWKEVMELLERKGILRVYCNGSFFFFFFNLLAMLHLVYGILITREGIRPKLQSLNCQGSPCGGSWMSCWEVKNKKGQELF